MNVIGELLLGAALGLTLAPPPGPMNVWIAAGAARSYRTGVATGLGAVAADAALGAVVFALYRSVDLAAASRAIYVAGAAALFWYAFRLFRAGRGATAPAGEVRSFLQALGLGLTNPYQILWWLTAGIGFAYVGGAPLLLGLFGALLAWVLAFPAVVRAGTRRSPRLERYVRVASGFALVGFALYFVALAVVG